MLDAPTTQSDHLTAAADPANEDAWAWLHNTYRQPIGRLCLRSGLSSVEADEVINDVLLRLSRRLATKAFTPGSGKLRAWLSQITHQCIFEVRRQHPCRDATGLFGASPGVSLRSTPGYGLGCLRHPSAARGAVHR